MRPFVTSEVADASKEMLRICVEITQEYMSVYKFMHEDRKDGGYWDRKPAREKAQEDFRNAQRKYDEVASLISNRISSLYALNPDEGR